MDGKILTLSLKELDKVMYYAVMPTEVHDQITLAILKGEIKVQIKESVWLKIQQDTKVLKAKNDLINLTAELNNKGIAAEKANNETKAIEFYEKNISQRCVATHAYDRLMKIYRRMKDYSNEERIINLAIEVFTEDNQRRYFGALKKTENHQYIDAIAIAHETNTGTKNAEGWYIYSPYDVMKYITRMEKVKKLKLKMDS